MALQKLARILRCQSDNETSPSPSKSSASHPTQTKVRLKCGDCVCNPPCHPSRPHTVPSDLIRVRSVSSLGRPRCLRRYNTPNLANQHRAKEGGIEQPFRDSTVPLLACWSSSAHQPPSPTHHGQEICDLAYSAYLPCCPPHACVQVDRYL